MLSFGFSLAMANAATIHHRGSMDQPLIVATLLDPVPRAINLSPTLNIKWWKLFFFLHFV
jgi:hypothetical protein